MINLRTLALAAALIGSVSAPAFADQDRVPEGATASGRWVAAESRTPLAGDPAQNLLRASGATGGAGQQG